MPSWKRTQRSRAFCSICPTSSRMLWRQRRQRGLLKRFSAIGGDFFESVPKADLYLLKHILHDWDDASCIRILKNCAQAMHQAGRVIVIEYREGSS